ncbi:MAG: sensor histidine kinase [Gemmatimonadales bacterium]
MRSGRLQRLAPTMVVALVALLAGLSFGTGVLIFRHFKADASATSRLYSGVFGGLNNPRPGAEAEALLRLGEQVRSLGLPLVVTDTAGRVTAAANLPFEAPLDDPRVMLYAARLDRQNPPITDAAVGTVHYGPLPAQRNLIALAILQGLTIAVMVGVAVFAYRSAMSAQRDRLWVAMAREAAHQMGTPLTSLQGWIERVRNHATPPPGLADHLSADAERLDRVAQRFERIGNPAKREPIGLGALADRVAGYYRPRLPRHANMIDLRVEAPGAGPTVLGDAVLLEWALESLVKNAIDALQGRPGAIILRIGAEEDTGAIRVIDDGPGVPKELRRTLFEPGTTTKRGGWGIGLALSRRVVEDAHGGALILESTEKGTCFLMRLPLAVRTP